MNGPLTPLRELKEQLSTIMQLSFPVPQTPLDVSEPLGQRVAKIITGKA